VRDIKRRLGARQVDSDRLGSRKAKNPADLGASRRSASNSQRFRTVCKEFVTRKNAGVAKTDHQNADVRS
jgi:hypothetical protein